MTDQIGQSARGLDLSPRFVISSTVVGSPAAAAETIVGQATLPGNLTIVAGVLLMGWAAYTTGTGTSAVTMRLRQTGLAGAIVASTGALTGGHNSAGLLVADDVNGFDTAPLAAGVYVLTLQVTGGSAGSPVSGVMLAALAV